jgi:hypothetical protein
MFCMIVIVSESLTGGDSVYIIDAPASVQEIPFFGRTHDRSCHRF